MEGDWSGSSKLSEVTDGQNTTTETHTNSEVHPKPLVLRLLEVENETEGEEGEGDEEEEDDEYKASKTSKASDSLQSHKASDSLQFRKGSDLLQLRNTSEPLQLPQVLKNGKGNLLPSTKITNSPSLMARYPPRPHLASRSSKFCPHPAEIHPSRTQESALKVHMFRGSCLLLCSHPSLNFKDTNEIEPRQAL